jgi:hypothetical protein
MAQSEATVTVANPTPPTNISCVSPGSAPSADGLAQIGAGVPVAPTAIATPVSGPAAEATGTVVIDTDPGGTSISVMGNFTATPNGSHATMAAPAVNATITGLVPATQVGVGGSGPLTVNGTGFTPQSVVSVNGVPQTTQFNSATQLKVLNAPRRSSAGNLPVIVTTGSYSTAATNWAFT